MKVDIIKKFKWYIVGFILVAIMLSVSLSFCTWDSLSLQAKMSASKSGNYKEHIKLVDDIYLSNGNKGVNGIADVGDIVTFGNYYQELIDDGKVADKTAIRWIVVEKVGTQLTLLAEKVIAFGSFWGNYYYNGSKWDWATLTKGTYYQNYSQSTVRAWLNSGTRTDGGTAIDKDSEEGVAFKGFLSEAFTSDEQEYIVSKQIAGITGYGKDNNPISPTEAYATVTDKVWLPSWSEVYGTTTTQWGTTIDGSPNTRFSYFKDTTYNAGNVILNGYTTAFASSQYSNYTFTGATHIGNAQSSSAGGNVWWWLRSPYPTDYSLALVVDTCGSGGHASTNYSYGGVRPALNVKL